VPREAKVQFEFELDSTLTSTVRLAPHTPSSAVQRRHDADEPNHLQQRSTAA